jgi:hypothetical protein
LNKNEERGKTTWEQTPPPPPSKDNASKEEKVVARQLCSSLQDDPATKSLREDVEIFMDLMKSFGNLSSLVPLDPVDPSAPENIPFWWKWNQIPSLIL